MEIIHLAGSSNRKVTGMCQEQTEQGRETENEIKQEASVHKSKEFQFYHNYNEKPF